ncbi:MAG: PQQ-like beta-propeller repeat protein [Tannerella sp.]|nr:PQQ-like beta-propeller repeat protein [Tannerella sp.]
MKSKRLFKIIGACTVCTCLCAPLSNAQHFHGWRGAGRDGIYHETGLLKTWAENGPQLLWETLDAGKGYSSPVVAGDRLYITGLNDDNDREVFSAYTLDGKQLYRTTCGSPWNDSYIESRTTPTIVGDRAYVVSGMGEVACIAVADGKIIWTVNGEKEFARKQGNWGTSESPLVYDNKVFYTPGGDKTAMVALDAATGKTVWESKPFNEFSAYVSPLLINHKGKRQIVGMTSGHVFGVNPDNGNIEWAFDDFGGDRTPENGGKISTNTPLFKDGRIFVCNGYNDASFMLELNDDATSVKLLWRNSELDTHIGGFVLVNGIIYGSNWINNGNGNWVAVDWNTGETRYENTWTGGKSKGSIIAADNMLYCYDERRGTVGLVNPDPEKFDVVSEFRITKGEGPHWAHPVIHNGTLYVRHGSALMAYKIK